MVGGGLPQGSLAPGDENLGRAGGAQSLILRALGIPKVPWGALGAQVIHAVSSRSPQKKEWTSLWRADIFTCPLRLLSCHRMRAAQESFFF